jgi:DNA topoisomerase-1
MVSKALGNTRTVCKKYYVHPLLIGLYETKSIAKYLKDLDQIEVDDNKSSLTKEEKILMNILKSN